MRYNLYMGAGQMTKRMMMDDVTDRPATQKSDKLHAMSMRRLDRNIFIHNLSIQIHLLGIFDLHSTKQISSITCAPGINPRQICGDQNLELLPRHYAFERLFQPEPEQSCGARRLS
jgi:hypothetical protein